MAGPTIQNDILPILLRFEQYRYVVSGDIEKMYRQLLNTPNQNCLLRILWRGSPDILLDVFELYTTTYGTTCEAFLTKDVFLNW